MTNQKNITIALLGGMVAGLLVFVFVLIRRIDQQTVSIETPALQRSASPAVSSLPSAAPPWKADLKMPARAGAPNPAAALTNADQKAKTEKLSALQKDIRALMAKSGGRPTEIDMDELDAILTRLINIQGSATLSGIDLAALRQNLAVAKGMQALAKELEAETKQPNPDREKIQKITEKIQSLQKEIRVNVMTPPASGVLIPEAGGKK
jgi:hypothetical protein